MGGLLGGWGRREWGIYRSTSSPFSFSIFGCVGGWRIGVGFVVVDGRSMFRAWVFGGRDVLCVVVA